MHARKPPEYFICIHFTNPSRACPFQEETVTNTQYFECTVAQDHHCLIKKTKTYKLSMTATVWKYFN